MTTVGSSTLVRSTRSTLVSQLLRTTIQFGTLALMSRLLLPEDFGRYSMVAIVVGFLWTIRDFGMGPAVIQRKELSQPLLSGLHWIVTTFGVVCCGLLILTAEVTAWLYRDPQIAPMLRAVSLAFPLTALGAVPLALMERRMGFTILARIEVMAAFLGASAALVAAWKGAGPWSLVIQALAGNAALTLLLWTSCSWHPSLSCDWLGMREVLHYSIPNAGSALASHVMRNIDNFLIGRYLGAEQLGYYNLAYMLLLFPVQNIAGAIARAMFPVLSRLQDDLRGFGTLYQKALGAIAFVIFPLVLGWWVLIEPFVLAVFGPRWVPAIPIMAILLPLAAVQSLSATTGCVYQAVGRTDLLFKWSVWTSPLIIGSIILGLRWGIRGVAICYALASLLIAYPGFKIPFTLIRMPMRSFIAATLKPTLYACLMALAVWLSNRLFLLRPVPALLFGIPLGAVIYGFLAFRFQKDLGLWVFRAFLGQKTGSSGNSGEG